MPKYAITLGTHGGQGSSPQYEVEAQSDLHASALAIRHFVRLGNQVAQMTTLDVEAANQGPQTLSVESVLRWLRRDGEGLAFAKEEGLEFLTASARL
jgi:hypothetical protein